MQAVRNTPKSPETTVRLHPWVSLSTRTQAEEEVVGDFFRNYAFRSDESIKALCEANGNIGQQILSWLRYKINDLKLRRSKDPWARDILRVERQYALALRETRKRPYNAARAKANGIDGDALT